MFKFKIASVTYDPNTAARDLKIQDYIQWYLDLLAKQVSDQVQTNGGTIITTIYISSSLAGTASAGAYVYTDGVTGKNAINPVQTVINTGISNSIIALDMRINLSAAFVDNLIKSATLSSSVDAGILGLFNHEFGHAMGFYSLRSESTGVLSGLGTQFDNYVSISGANVSFVGAYAKAIYGSDVPLYALGYSGRSIAHLTNNKSNPLFKDGIANDPMIGEPNVSDASNSKFSDLDLAIMRDTGYMNLQTLISRDGHTFVPGLDTKQIIGTNALSDKVFLTESRNEINLTKSATGAQLQIKGTGQTIDLKGIETVEFKNYTVDLNVAKDAKSILPDQVDKLVQLYIAFFNRVPDGTGMDYWINRVHDGMSMTSVADSFFLNAVAHSDVTGYKANATNEDLVRTVYANVLSRTAATVLPDEAGVQYWIHDLDSGVQTKASLINSMIVAALGYANDPTWQWSTNLLNNKLAVGKYFAIEQGLGYADYNTAITESIRILAAVTPTDTVAAIKLIGMTDTGWSAA